MDVEDEVADRAIHAQADKSKADLTQGTDTVVPQGDEPTPPAKVDPFAARKALFAKSGAQRAAEIERLRADNPAVDDSVRNIEQATRNEPPITTAPPSKTEPVLQQGNEPVTITYEGRSVKVARSDIERAGGEEMYIRARRADDREAALAVQEAEAAERRAELERQIEQREAQRREEEARRQAAGQDGHADGSPARSGERDAGATPDPGEHAVDLRAQATEMVEKIYSGQPQEAAEAIEAILNRIESSRSRVTAEEVARRAIEQMRQQQPQQPVETPVTTQPKPDPRWEVQRAAINAMAERDFPNIAHDPSLATLARNEIQRLCALPENRDRRAIDVAAEACEAVSRRSNTDARTQVRAMKQGLPTIPSAGGTAPTVVDKPPLTGSAYVEMLAKRRRFT